MGTLHSVSHGSGIPLLVLHGAGVDHREPEAAFEPLLSGGNRVSRIYVDLPGMGRSPAEPADDIARSVADLAEALSGTEGFLLAGHSLGAYFARTVAALLPERCRGLALVCPFGASTEVPQHGPVDEEPGYAEILGSEHLRGFQDYFVRRTPRLARRYLDAVVPGIALADDEALARMFDGFPFAEDGLGGLPAPVVIVAGRQDSTVGWRGAVEMADRYPASTVVVCDGAGHALPHERPELLGAAFADWLDRAL